MKNEVIESIVCAMIGTLDDEQLFKLKSELHMKLCDYELVKRDTEITLYDNIDYILVEKFCRSKLAAGKANKTVKIYAITVKNLIDYVGKRIINITDDDIRKYIYYCMKVKKNKYVTLRNTRAYLNSFFSWLRKNKYINENPMDLIEAIKPDKIIKQSFSDEEIVRMKDACTNLRDIAMIDFLNSSMVRVSELIGLNISDVVFSERECIVFGKGREERIAYFDGVAKIHIQQYIASRKDSNPALFIGIDGKNKRLTVSGIESILKKIGNAANVQNVHPHRFRRTGANRCLEHGMPIDQVQYVMGHKNISTTQIYARSSKVRIKSSYISIYS